MNPAETILTLPLLSGRLGLIQHPNTAGVGQFERETRILRVIHGRDARTTLAN
jgi:hypothetical protein